MRNQMNKYAVEKSHKVQPQRFFIFLRKSSPSQLSIYDEKVQFMFPS